MNKYVRVIFVIQNNIFQKFILTLLNGDLYPYAKIGLSFFLWIVHY